MNSCTKCLENNWNYQYLEGWIRATCICGNEVEFVAKKKSKKERWSLWEKGQCTKCDGKVIKRFPKEKAKRKKQEYYYTQYWKCLKCRTMFMDERFKVFN